mgnify:CR=1 FL=1
MIINVIPLAWKWQRFVDEWYKIPKPIIDVRWKKMIFRSFESLPKSKKNIFIVFEEHINKYKLDILLKENINNCIVISDKNPGWQASTTYKIKQSVDKNDIINIWACDNAMIYNEEKYKKYIEDDNIDFMVWTFRNYSWVNYNPEQYSYCIIDNIWNIEKTSLKKSISNNPINDHCMVWAFTFKKACYFFDWFEELRKDNNTINWEFYIDSIVDYCIKKWLKWKVFEIDKYIWFWTPNDLKTYEYWFDYFNNKNL